MAKMALKCAKKDDHKRKEEKNMETVEIDTVELEAMPEIITENLDTEMSVEGNTLYEEEMMAAEPSQSGSVNTHVVLWVVIGVCAIVGVVLGIIMGKKAAYK